MESEILKCICANQGAVDAEDLMFNLFPGESTNEVISNQNKFVLYSSYGKQKVVARTSLRLCRTKDCPGSCGRLHLCKNFLFCGLCHYIESRRFCSFSHYFNSDHNQKVLKEHELEGLNREELGMLLLQSDYTLLPSICHDYNNGKGEFGQCQSGIACAKLHICKKYLSQDCSCSRNHDFYTPQPLKCLSDRGFPNIPSCALRSVYANKEALRLAADGGARGHRSNRSSAVNADAKSDEGQTVEQKQFYRGRGRGGNRGQRGNRGGRGNGGRPPQQQRAVSPCDSLDLYSEDGSNKGDNHQRELHSSNLDVSVVSNDTDSKSNNGLNAEQKQWYQGRGRGGGRGQSSSRGNGGNPRNPSQQLRTSSLADIPANSDFFDLSADEPNDGDGQQRGLNSPSSDVPFVGNNMDASGPSDQSKTRAKNQNPTSAVRGKDNKHEKLHRTRCIDDIHAALSSKDRNVGDVQNQKTKQKPVKDKTEICLFFIKGYCKHEDRCVRAHDKMPYRWQVQEDDQWNALPDNETIEKDYCDPKNSYSSKCPPVHFDTMTRGSNKVRRLSTVNSLLQPDLIHTTEWLWYWEDEFGKWNPYGSDSGGHKSADISSSKLEQKYLVNNKDVVEFTAGSQPYSLSFQDMIQTNRHYSTKRLVSRRPLFVSAAEVKTKKVKKPENSTPVPDNWDKTQIPQTGFSKVVLQRTSEEFQKVEAVFCSTMRGFDIIEIERIQNRALWEVFQWQKNLMKNKNGGLNVTEKELFHGTDSHHIDAICLNNFDWRICGTHGTVFGKGSYFARDARYSHGYTGDANIKTMFMSRVLVGSYTKGTSSYVKPPSKDGGDLHFYDSCVDDVTNPSIFVVFEKHQIYPEYLLRYKTKDPLEDVVSGAPAANSCVIA